jgi:hypothetical protein
MELWNGTTSPMAKGSSPAFLPSATKGTTENALDMGISEEFEGETVFCVCPCHELPAEAYAMSFR